MGKAVTKTWHWFYCYHACIVAAIVEAALGSLLAYTLCSTSWWNHARITGICYWCSKSSQSGNVYFVSNNHQDIIHAHCCISCIIYRAYCSLLLSDSFEHFYFRLTAISRQICVYNSKVHGPTDKVVLPIRILQTCLWALVVGAIGKRTTICSVEWCKKCNSLHSRDDDILLIVRYEVNIHRTERI